MKSFLLQEGTDPKYGARHLKRAIERHMVFPLANLVATGQVKLGDFVRIDMNADGADDVCKGSRRRDGAGAAGALRSSGGCDGAAFGTGIASNSRTPGIRGDADRQQIVFDFSP